MARTPKPWYWKARKTWCVTVEGDRHNLGPDEAEAKRRFHALMAQPEHEQAPPRPSGKGHACGDLADLFMDYVQANNSPETYDWYRARLQRWLRVHGSRSATSLKAYEVQQWLDRQLDWGNSYKAGMVTAIKRVFNWAVEQGHIEHTPLGGLKKPEADHRGDVCITPVEFKELLPHAPPAIRDLMEFVWLTGCRPEEVVKLEARHYEPHHQRMRLPRAEAKGGEDVRLIYLPDEAVQIVERSLSNQPTIFLNANGRPWTADAVGCAVGRWQLSVGYARMNEAGIKITDRQIDGRVADLMRKKRTASSPKTERGWRGLAFRQLRDEEARKRAGRVCLYVLRHSYANQAIVDAGLSFEEAAALLGHKDTAMIYKVYGHLKESSGQMRNLVNRSAQARNGGS